MGSLVCPVATLGQEAGLVKSHEAPLHVWMGGYRGPPPPQPARTWLLCFAPPWGPWYLHPRHVAHGSALGRHEEGLKVQQLEEVMCLEAGLLGDTEGQVAPTHPSGFNFSLT